MFVKPQIASTPHLIAPMAQAADAACSAGFIPCPTGFGSCSPYGDWGCVDTSFSSVVGSFVIIGSTFGAIVVAK